MAKYIRELLELPTQVNKGDLVLKKLVADILDRIDQFPDFDPHQHYKLTLQDTELTATERQAASATSVDDIALTLK